MAIIKLPNELREHIAAGEVVENPASVLKELVENALDAGSSFIEVRVKKGGTEEIKVTDDGCGISGNEAHLAFERHATSKISNLNDLYNIRSLGFRGEALASISAVSRVKLITRTPESISGTSLLVEGGELISLEETGAPVGTEITVRDLFFNTPARRSFLKTVSGEMRKISTLITGLAFSNPKVSFSLWNENKQVFKSRGDGNILEIITEAYGSEISRSMLKLEDIESDIHRVNGYISSPAISRTTRTYQNILVNRRLVRSTLISQSMRRGYEGLIPAGRFPVAVIYLETDPQFLDVNIHPAKTEIKFQDEQEINRLIYKTVTTTLRNNSNKGQNLWTNDSYSKLNARGKDQEAHKDYSLDEKNYRSYVLAENKNDTGYHEKSTSANEKPSSLPQKEEESRLFPEESCRVIGQYLSSYIVIQKSDELFILDQHAAHERIIFEKLRRQIRNSGTETIMLSAPLKIEIPSTWEGEKEEILQLLARQGFEIEGFGNNTYVVRSIPAFLSDYFNEDYFWVLFEDLAENKEIVEDISDILLKTAACKGAVKANQKLDQREMFNLIKEWENTENAYFCPHGRPAVLTFSRHELERGFQRKGGKGNH